MDLPSHVFLEGTNAPDNTGSYCSSNTNSFPRNGSRFCFVCFFVFSPWILCVGGGGAEGLINLNIKEQIKFSLFFLLFWFWAYTESHQAGNRRKKSTSFCPFVSFPNAPQPLLHSDMKPQRGIWQQTKPPTWKEYSLCRGSFHQSNPHSLQAQESRFWMEGAQAFFKYLFIYLAAPGLRWGMWDLLIVACGLYFPDRGSNPGPPALGAWSLNHWTTREVPGARALSQLILIGATKKALPWPCPLPITI